MNTQEFEEQLRRYLQQEPFQPFEVELASGQVIDVLHPKVVFGGGGASFLTDSYELVEFNCEDVRAFRPSLREATR